MPFIVTAVTAVAGAISGVLAAGGIGAALLRIGGTLLLSYAAQALMPKPQATLANRTVTIREPVVPRDLVYGRTRKGGVIVFLHASGPADQYLDLVVVLAAHRVKSIGAIYFEGEMALNAAGVAQGRWAGKVLVEKKLGATNQTAFAGLKAALPDKWTENHRLQGCAAIRLRLTYDQDAFPGGIPNITVDLEGKDDIWDPRTQSAGYSENPALCLADYMANPTWGVGARIGAADGIDEMSLVEAANICDEVVLLAGGGTEPRYTCNGVITLTLWALPCPVQVARCFLPSGVRVKVRGPKSSMTIQLCEAIVVQALGASRASISSAAARKSAIRAAVALLGSARIMLGSGSGDLVRPGSLLAQVLSTEIQQFLCLYPIC